MKKVINQFLQTFATKCIGGEDLSYVELMMDNHFCINWEDEEYYIPENNSLYTQDDEMAVEFLNALYIL